MQSPIESVVETLNLALAANAGAVQSVLSSVAVTGGACGGSFQDLPTIPVNADGYLSGLGLLNGVIRAATGNTVAATYDASGKLIRFSVRDAPRKLIAIPLLVYVMPTDEDPEGGDAEQRIADVVRALDEVAEAFLAEDFATSEYYQDPGDDLTAMIGAACNHL